MSNLISRQGCESSLDKQSKSPFSSSGLNSRRYFWLFIGYYIVVLFARSSHAQAAVSTSDAAPSTTEPAHHEEHAGHKGISLLHVDWLNVESIFLVTLWIFMASIAKIAFHMTPKVGHLFPESCLLVIVGILIGIALYTSKIDIGAEILPTKTFFFFMLPPIILDAGYFMPSQLFFGNLGTILLFAVIGTLWNTFTIGMTLWGCNGANLFGTDLNLLEIFLFSSLISAVDPVAVLAVFEEVHVNDILYIVVFGESLLNDAVTIVLYHTFVELTQLGPDNITSGEVIKGVASFPIVALGGTIFGVIWGFLIGFATKYTYHVLIIEPIFVFVMAYLAFLSAELFHFSGVLALIFCGLTMKNYVQANIAPTSNTTVKYTLKMLSSSSETIIFIFLGVSTINDMNVWNTWFVVVTVAACTVYRFVGVFLFTAVINKFRLNKLGFVDQIVMSYGGLRGAVSFALVLLIEDDTIKDQHTRRMFVTTTIAVVYFTVFLQGTTIKPLVEWLRVKRAQARELTMSESIHERLMEHSVTAMEFISGQNIGHNILRDIFRTWDSKYIKPWLIRDYENRMELKFLETYENLVFKEAVNDFRRKKVLTTKFNADIIKPIPEEGEDQDSIGPDEEVEVIISTPPPMVSRETSFIRRPRSISTILQPKISDPNSPVQLNIFDNANMDKVFRPVRSRKFSYNRHTLEFGELEGDIDMAAAYIDSINGPASPAGIVARKATRKIGIAHDGPLVSRPRPGRTSQTSLQSQRFSTDIAPNSELLQQPGRLYTSNIDRPLRRTGSSTSSHSGSRPPTSATPSFRGISIAENEENTAGQLNEPQLNPSNPEIPNSPDSVDDVFDK